MPGVDFEAPLAATAMMSTTTTTADETMWNQDFSTAVFRIFQETLTNIIHHSAATQVTVVLTVEADELLLAITDNGRGITEAEIASAKSIGLIGMRERASLLAGEVAFTGTPGQGTTVTVRLPLSAARILVAPLP